jgi:cell wall-associated NlpC family hydrolase
MTTVESHFRSRGSCWARTVAGFVLASVGLAACSDSATPSAQATVPTTTTLRATGLSSTTVASTSTRWVAVAVGTLWVSRGSARAIDRLTTMPPASARAWISALSLSQKQGLVGRVETQALYGTAVVVTATSRGWSRIVVPSQPTPRDRRGYPGWIPTWQLTATAPASSARIAVVRSATAWIRNAPGINNAARVMEVSYDTRLPVVATSPSSVEVSLLDGRHGYLRPQDVYVHRSDTSMTATGRQVIAEARKFLGLQYLWGGTTGYGYDCSGYTYSVLHVLGVTIPRDAAPQATKGVLVTRQNLMPGDLVFFRDSSGGIVHVAIFFGSAHGVPSVIHSPNTGQPVSITPLSAWPNSSYAGARRYVVR